jgi:hypothetical protein
VSNFLGAYHFASWGFFYGFFFSNQGSFSSLQIVFEGKQRITRLHQVGIGTHHTFAEAIPTDGSGIGDVPNR